MNGKNGNNRTKILLVDLLEYIAKYQYARYIFSSHYNDECLNENVNKHTLRMNLVFKEMSIKFNPNQFYCIISWILSQQIPSTLYLIG